MTHLICDGVATPVCPDSVNLPRLRFKYNINVYVCIMYARTYTRAVARMCLPMIGENKICTPDKY
jgi:hypothetical protein